MFYSTSKWWRISQTNPKTNTIRIPIHVTIALAIIWILRARERKRDRMFACRHDVWRHISHIRLWVCIERDSGHRILTQISFNLVMSFFASWDNWISFSIVKILIAIIEQTYNFTQETRCFQLLKSHYTCISFNFYCIFVNSYNNRCDWLDMRKITITNKKKICTHGTLTRPITDNKKRIIFTHRIHSSYFSYNVRQLHWQDKRLLQMIWI